jgi:hypothetical protein
LTARAFALVFLLGCAVVPREARGEGWPLAEGDVLYIGGTVERMSPGDGGGGGQLGWHHVFSSRLSADAGWKRSSLGTIQWSLVRLATQVRVGGSIAYAESHLGRGRREDVRFPYQVHSGGIVVPVLPARVFVDLGVQHLHVDATRGWLIKASALGALSRAIAGEIGVHRAAGGLPDAWNASARIDVRRPGVGGLAGINLGRSRPEVLVTTAGATTRSRQGFAGLRYQLAGCELTLVASALRVEGVTRKGVEMALTWRPRHTPAP